MGISVVLGAKFGANHASYIVHQRFVKGCGQADRLRKDSRGAGTGYPMQSFIPPVVLRNAESRNGIRGVSQLRDLFLERHAGDKVVDAAANFNFGISIERIGRRLLREQPEPEETHDRGQPTENVYFQRKLLKFDVLFLSWALGGFQRLKCC
jgi:hypothetical protein